MSLTWQAAEALGYAYYIQKGYRVFIPMIETKDYDFVVEFKNKFSRVNVKKAHLTNGGSYVISRSGASTTPTAPVADVYLAYIDEHQSFVEVSGNFFLKYPTSKIRAIPKEVIDEICKKQNKG